MKSKLLQWLAIFLIFELGFLHFMTAQNDYLKTPYLGYLAMSFFLGALIAVFGIYHRQTWGWVVGALAAICSILVFGISRTIGLPGQAVEPWLAPFDLIEAATGGFFILLLFIQPWKGSVPSSDQAIPPIWFRYLLPSLAILSVTALSFSTYQWDVYARVVGYHQHVGSLRAVCNTPVTSFDELESLYGIKISQMNISMMGSIVDVRLMIVDPDKAQALLQNQGALLVNQEALILAPHQHAHSMLKKDKAHIMFFPTMNNTIHSGSMVSLVFGHVRVEPVIIR
jgi:hypothetical protein